VGVKRKSAARGWILGVDGRNLVRNLICGGDDLVLDSRDFDFGAVIWLDIVGVKCKVHSEARKAWYGTCNLQEKCPDSGVKSAECNICALVMVRMLQFASGVPKGGA